MDTGLDAIIKVYSQEALEETASELLLSLNENIKTELYPGHGYDTGALQRSVHDYISSQSDTEVVITATYEKEYGDYVIEGIRGKGRVEPINFLKDGLEKTIAMYG